MSFDNLPSYHELPEQSGLKGCAWDVWGKDDQLGTVNMLTKEVVQRAASEEIKTGRTVALNWPIDFPTKPSFNRKPPEHKVFGWMGIVHDDELHINTQSGTQWDGLRHFGIASSGKFYQGLHVDDIPKEMMSFSDPMNIDKDRVKLGIHNWAQHGICGRGVLVDLVKFYTDSGRKPLPYDPWTTHPIPLQDIKAAADKQGLQFRQGDILLLRVGFIQKYNTTSQAERDDLTSRPEAFAGIEQTEDMKAFLWNNHFAAIASDQPALERWPPAENVVHLHQTILNLWGMPIGEFFDLEGLAKIAEETGRHTFFFSSWPLNVLGGVASPPNAAAYF